MMESGVEQELLRLVDEMKDFMDGVAGLVTDLVRAQGEIVEVVEDLDREVALLSRALDGRVDGEVSATAASLAGQGPQARPRARRLAADAAARAARAREAGAPAGRVPAE